MSIELLIQEMSGKSTFVIDPTHCINRAIYVQEVMSTLAVKKFLTVLKDKLKQM